MASPIDRLSEAGSTARLNVRSIPLGVSVAVSTRSVSGLTTCTAPSSSVNVCVAAPIFRTVEVAPGTNSIAVDRPSANPAFTVNRTINTSLALFVIAAPPVFTSEAFLPDTLNDGSQPDVAEPSVNELNVRTDVSNVNWMPIESTPAAFVTTIGTSSVAPDWTRNCPATTVFCPPATITLPMSRPGYD